MYLEPESVKSTLQTIREYAGIGSRVVFDYIQASVLRHENTLYGESGLAKTVSKAGEQWRFGIEPDEIASFAAACASSIETIPTCSPSLPISRTSTAVMASFRRLRLSALAIAKSSA